MLGEVQYAHIAGGKHTGFTKAKNRSFHGTDVAKICTHVDAKKMNGACDI
jgi:hypothetical protein